jgi:hypothetical protein
VIVTFFRLRRIGDYDALPTSMMVVTAMRIAAEIWRFE